MDAVVEAARVVFEIRDDTGVAAARIDAKDVPKKLPAAFQLKRRGKGKPMLLLYRSKECDPKLSGWLEDWAALPFDEERWVTGGWSIIKVRLVCEFERKFADIFNGLPPSRNVRAEYFHRELRDELKAEFATLSSRAQIELLLVSTAMRAQFQRPDFGLRELCRYAEHIATRHERRMQEAQAAEEKSRAAALPELRRMRADRYNVAEDDNMGFIGAGTATYTHEVVRKERSLFDMFGYSMSALIEGSELEQMASDKLSAPVVVPIQPKLTQSDMKQTERLLARIRSAQETRVFNRDVRHICFFFYVLRYIRMQRACGVFYTTESILDGGPWIRRSDCYGLSFRTPLEVTPLDDEEMERDAALLAGVLLGSVRRRREHNYY